MAKLSDLVNKYKGDMLSIARLSSATLSTKVVTRTPVDTGLLRRSWTPDINGIDESNRGGDISATVNNMELGDTYSLTNGQPYARRIEYEGHSPKAPAGMLRISVAEWDAIVDEAARGG